MILADFASSNHPQLAPPPKKLQNTRGRAFPASIGEAKHKNDAMGGVLLQNGHHPNGGKAFHPSVMIQIVQGKERDERLTFTIGFPISRI